MYSFRSALVSTFLCAATLVGLGCKPASAGSADHWYLAVGTVGHGSVLGSSIGMDPRAQDGYDSPDQTLDPAHGGSGVQLLYYRVHGPDWAGPTGFYGGDYEKTSIPPGGVKTWYEFYLFAQNFTPTAANFALVAPDGAAYAPPAGYRGHLVLDYVPASCNWKGDWDFWLDDLTAVNTFALPIPVVTDPLQGTQFHIDVYAPAVPEPSSLAALICGLVGVGGAVVRRRRNRG